MRSERGEGRIGVLVWLALAGAAIYVGIQAIPTRIAVLELHDYCDEQTMYAASSHRYSKEELIKNVLNKAEDLDIPLKREQIEYDAQPRRLELHLKHEITIDLSVYQWTWKYDKTFEHLRL